MRGLSAPVVRHIRPWNRPWNWPPISTARVAESSLVVRHLLDGLDALLELRDLIQPHDHPGDGSHSGALRRGVLILGDADERIEHDAHHLFERAWERLHSALSVRRRGAARRMDLARAWSVELAKALRSRGERATGLTVSAKRNAAQSSVCCGA